MTDAVFEKIALRAALGVDGAVRHDGSVAAKIGSLVGREATSGSAYPRVRVEAAGGKPHVVDLAIAVRWPSPVSAVCRRVRTHVADELERLTGWRPVRVDVEVAAVVAGPGARRAASGYVALPAPDAATTIEAAPGDLGPGASTDGRWSSPVEARGSSSDEEVVP